MMKKFQEQLNEKTQILQTEIKNQKSSLETLKEQLQDRNNSKSQVSPSITGHVRSLDLLEPVPKKPRYEAMKSPFSDISEATSVSGSCLPPSSQIPEELQNTFDSSSQVPNQEEVKQQQQQQPPLQQSQLQQTPLQQPPLQQQQLQRPQQEQQLLLLPEQPQPYNTTGENQVMHVFMPNQPSFSMLRYNDGFTPLPLPLRPPPPPPPPPPSVFTPIQMVAEQQPSGYYHAENLNAPGYYRVGNLNASGYHRAENFNASGYYRAENFNGPENGRFRFFPENHHQPRMNLFSMTHGPGSHAIYTTSLPQTTTITHNPQLVTMETPQDYVRLCERPQDPRNHLYQAVQMSNWAPNEQATMGQATCAQMAPTEQVQHSSSLQTVQASGTNGLNRLNSCMSSQQSQLNL